MSHLPLLDTLAGTVVQRGPGCPWELRHNPSRWRGPAHGSRTWAQLVRLPRSAGRVPESMARSCGKDHLVTGTPRRCPAVLAQPRQVARRTASPQPAVRRPRCTDRACRPRTPGPEGAEVAVFKSAGQTSAGRCVRTVLRCGPVSHRVPEQPENIRVRGFHVSQPLTHRFASPDCAANPVRG